MPTPHRPLPPHLAFAARCGGWLLVALVVAALPVAATAQAEPTPVAPAPAGEWAEGPDNDALAVLSWSFSVLSPYRAHGKSGQLLDSAARRLALDLDYGQEAAGERPRRTAALPGVQAARYLAKPVDDGWTRIFELALADYPEGGFVLHVVGFEDDGTERRPNAELAAAEAALQGLLRDLQQAQAQMPSGRLGGPGNRFVGYKLSYVQSDRAAALLKVLGYSVIEFQATNPQPLVYDKIFDALPPQGELRLPVVIRLIDSDKTSLLEPVQGAMGASPSSGGGGGAGAPLSLGGLFLDRVTAGVPPQRLLIVYDADDPEPMQVLVNLLRDQIDIPAQQILIEALVVELNQDHLSDVGIDFNGSDGRSSYLFGDQRENGQTINRPFTYIFDQAVEKTVFQLKVTLGALVTRGQAQVLSRPSVLVLDGRQARIQVGEKIPYTSNIAATNTGTLSSTDYLTTGIVLNLRPRISQDGSQVTMQVETIISSAGPSSFVSGVLVAPPIQSREVQSLVRVANNTPFIIGGLIDTQDQTNVRGVPGLSRIPWLGRLFRKQTKTEDKREVIVVITPHVIPLEDRTFSYVIPKDSEIFDSFGKQVFRNVYRIRPSDVFDLSFVHESQVLHDLVRRLRSESELEPGLATEEPFRSILAGRVPGEDILVRRMLWELVHRQGFNQHVDPEKIFFFQQSAGDGGLDVTLLRPLVEGRDDRRRNALVLAFEGAATSLERPFDPPRGSVSYEPLTADRYYERLRQGNRRRDDGTYERNTLLITDAYPTSRSPEEVLRGVLVLKRILELNPELPLTLDGFHVGLEIVFPSIADLRERLHLVDRQTARLFYEVTDYYRAFEQEFSSETRRILGLLDGGGIGAGGIQNTSTAAGLGELR